MRRDRGSRFPAAHATVTRRRIEESRRRILELLVGDWSEKGLHQVQIENLHATEKKMKQLAEERQRGYLGWLVTNPVFVRERDDLREVCEDRVQDLGGFPRIAVSLFGQLPAPPLEPYREFWDYYTAFCRRW